jgi:hypothetical protein
MEVIGKREDTDFVARRDGEKGIGIRTEPADGFRWFLPYRWSMWLRGNENPPVDSGLNRLLAVGFAPTTPKKTSDFSSAQSKSPVDHRRTDGSAVCQVSACPCPIEVMKWSFSRMP